MGIEPQITESTSNNQQDSGILIKTEDKNERNIQVTDLPSGKFFDYINFHTNPDYPEVTEALLKSFLRSNYGPSKDRSFCFSIQRLLFDETEIIDKVASGKGKKKGLDPARKFYLSGMLI